MSNLNKASYSFLPWVRLGLANYLEPGNDGRTIVPVSVNLKSDTKSVDTETKATLPISLISPGDIIGIQERMIIKTSPQANELNVEWYNLPFVEFYDEDLPWRYTPAKPVDEKITPWLFLLVLAEGEFIIEQNPLVPLPGLRLQPGANIGANIFPDPATLWAWAHVHVNGELTSATDATTFLNGDLKSNPDLAYSRLLSPRHLKPGTSYQAFLIPTFEAGRLAGLGETATVPPAPTKVAWDLTGTATNDVSDILFPFYHHWSFRTGTQDDFLTQVSQLQPLDLNSVSEGPLATLRGQPMDISEVGYGITLPANESEVVLLPGVLKLAEIDPAPPAMPVFQEQIRQVLNLSHNQLTSGLTNTAADPVVTPPIYGQWHANLTAVPSTLDSTSWLQAVNLDPRYRAVAGIGSRIVQLNQEKYVRQAWEQLGNLPAANNFLRTLQAGTKVLQAIQGKFLDANTGGISDRSLLLMGPALRQIKSTDNLTVEQTIQKSPIPAAVFDGAFRRMAKPYPLAAGGGTITNTGNLITKFNNGQVAAAGTKPNTINNSPQEPYYYPVGPGALSAMRQLSAYPNFKLKANSSTQGLTIEQTAKLKDAISLLPGLTEYNNFVPVALNLSTTRTSILNNINIASSAVKLVNANISLSEPVTGAGLTPGGFEPLPVVATDLTDIKPIRTSPYFKQPMYEVLKDYAENLFFPGINQIPQNTITVLEVNQKFIEAFMVGLNHELAAELLWREFPTDGRASYFRQFWDPTDFINSGLSEEDKTDIIPFHTWPINTALGDHETRITQTATAGNLTLLIRADLLKKFPNAIIYAQELLPGDGQPVLNGQKIFPSYRADLVSDITILMFELDVETVSSSALGWYFVFGERPGEPKFGLEGPFTDDPVSADPANPDNWEHFSWQHLPAETSNLNPADLVLTNPPASVIGSIGNSAHLAYATFRKPGLVAIPIKDFIPNL